ncbi:MAG: hypothetical protein E7016_02055 [Alphaproteobacteria bacterium]|nr:hypothetical protein [Alphaproteobacteria bacterium]
MRKYFLLSAVALLAATSANATTDYAEVTARATIEVAGKISCTDMNFGTIVVKKDNAESVVDMNYIFNDESYWDVSTQGDIISITGYDLTKCENGFLAMGDPYHPEFPSEITLSNGTSKITVTDVYYDGEKVSSAKLHIPAKVTGGEYTTSFTIQQVMP